MKSIKVFYHGVRLKDIYPYATKWEVIKYKTMKFIRKALLVVMTGVIGFITHYGAYTAGALLAPDKAKADVINVTIEAVAPVMDRIAQCESGKRQFNADGSIVKHKNSDGTTDEGYYQINSIHYKAAYNLGFDIDTEAGNKGYGEWLYHNEGTGPWYSSRACWQ